MNEVLACSECGLMVDDGGHSRSLYCPRCESNLRKKEHSIEYSLAMAYAALICFIPANFLPILRFQLGGGEQTDTMFSALYYFYMDGYPELSAVVFFTAILAPLVHIILSIILLTPLWEGKKPAKMKPIFKTLFHLRHWVMLDVYMIAILVAIVKLSDTADLIYETGLFMFATLMLFSFLLSNSFSPKVIWRAYHNAH